MSNPRYAKHGSINGTPLNVDISRIDHGAAPVKVQLTANYTISREPGMPSRPCFTGATAINLDYPRTIASGTVISVLKGEADALVAAGAATYV